jgi:hypothetical protein
LIGLKEFQFEEELGFGKDTSTRGLEIPKLASKQTVAISIPENRTTLAPA